MLTITTDALTYAAAREVRTLARERYERAAHWAEWGFLTNERHDRAAAATAVAANEAALERATTRVRDAGKHLALSMFAGVLLVLVTTALLAATWPLLGLPWPTPPLGVIAAAAAGSYVASDVAAHESAQRARRARLAAKRDDVLRLAP